MHTHVVDPTPATCHKGPLPCRTIFNGSEGPNTVLAKAASIFTPAVGLRGPAAQTWAKRVVHGCGARALCQILRMVPSNCPVMLRLFRQPRSSALLRLAARVPPRVLSTPRVTGVRFQTTQNPESPGAKQENPASDAQSLATLKGDTPQLMIAFTCKKCETRSSHTFSKQAYTKGSVLIQCPGCKNRHLIADNLKIFRDDKVNLEDLLKAHGESVATTPEDLAFEDIPESLKKTLGHYAKDAPEEYQQKEQQKFIEGK